MKTYQLSDGNTVIIDDEDEAMIAQSSWNLTAGRYASSFRDDKIILMHRLLMNAPDNMDVDHINGDGLDNRKANLRLATRSQNMQNQRKRFAPTTSKYKGVYYNAGTVRRKRWVAQICFEDRSVICHYFHTEEEAARAYDALAHQHFGEYARLNFPNDDPTLFKLETPSEKRDREKMIAKDLATLQITQNERLKLWRERTGRPSLDTYYDRIK